MDTDIASRLLKIENRHAIADQIYRYARAADAQDADGMAGVFTLDCEAHYSAVFPVAYGRQMLRDFCAANLSRQASSHHMSGIEYDFVSSDAARTHHYLYSWERFIDYPAKPDRHRWGRYHLEWRCIDGTWLISRLELLVAGELGGDRLGESVGRSWGDSALA